MPTARDIQPATSSAMNTLSSMMKQFLDNVNAGKLVTDVGPGLALTVPLLMLVAVLTATDLVPAQQVPHLRKNYIEVYTGVRREVEKLDAILATDPRQNDAYAAMAAVARLSRKPASPPRVAPSNEPKSTDESEVHPRAPLPDAWDETERDASAALALLAADLATSRRFLNADPTPGTFVRIELLAANQKLIETKLAQLKAQRAQLAEIRKTYDEATSVTKNLEIWESNIALVAGAAVVLGVIISQAARLIFFEFLFVLIAGAQRIWRRFWAPAPDRPALITADTNADKQRAMTALLKQRSPAFAAAYQDLVTNHLRYAEGAVNMAVPVLLFGCVYPEFAATFMPENSGSAPHASSVLRWSWFIGLCMIAGGCITYLRFREKERAWLSQNLETIAISEATTAALAAEKNSAESAKKAEEFAKASQKSADAAKATTQVEIAPLQTTVAAHTTDIAALQTTVAKHTTDIATKC